MHFSRRWMVVLLAVLASLFLALYLLVRPIAMETLEPQLSAASKERIRGTLSWRAVDLDPTFDLQFNDLELRDASGRRVFFAPSLTVHWTIAGALDVWLHDAGISKMVQTVRVETPEIAVTKAADGSWNVQNLVISESDGPSEFRGRILFSGGKASVSLPVGETYTAENLSGQVIWGTGGVIEALIDGRTFGTDVSGKLVYTDEKRYYGKVETKDFSLEKLSPLMSLLPDSVKPAEISGGNGKITKAEIDCKEGKITYLAEGEISGASLSLSDTHLKELNTDFKLTEEKLSLSQMGFTAENAGVSAKIAGNADVSFGDKIGFSGALTVGDGRVSGNGSHATKTGEIYAMYDISDLDLSLFRGFADVGGRVSGKGSVFATQQNGAFSLHRMEGDFTGKDLAYGTYGAKLLAAHAAFGENQSVIDFDAEGISGQGLYLDTASGQVVGADQNWDIPCVMATMGGGAIVARGTYDNGTFDISAETAGLDIAPFSFMVGRNIGGTASCKGRIFGTPDAFSYAADFQLSEGFVDGADIQFAEGKVHGDSYVLVIDESKLTLSEGVHQISGSVGLSGAHALSLTEKTEHARIENVLKLTGIAAPVTGWFDNTVTIGGTMENPKVAGNILATEGSIAGELYQSVYVDYEYADGAFKIPNGFGYLYGGSAQAVGVYENDTLNFTLALVDVDLDRIMPTAPVKGHATFRGKLSGSLSSPEFTGHAESREILINEKGLGRVSADVMYKDGVFRITEGYFQHRAGEFMWNGLVNAETGALDGQLKFQKWRFKDAFDLFGIPVQNVAGTMDGMMRLRGTIKNPNVSLTMTTNDGKLGHISMGDGRLDMSYANHIFTIRELELPVGAGLLTAGGTVQKDGALDMKATSKNLDLSFLSEIFDMKGTTVGGLLTSEIDVKGTVKDPEATISVKIAQPSYNDFVFNELSFAGRMGAGKLAIDEAYVTKDDYKATLSGGMPVAAILREEDGRQIPFDLTLNLDHADLNALVLFAKPVQSAKGPIDGRLRVTGPWDDPEIKGNISVENGEMTVATMAEAITPISGTMQFTGKEATISAEAKVRENIVTATGRAAWDKSRLTDYTGELHASCPSLHSDYYTGALYGDIMLSEEHDLPKIAGKVNIENATITVPLSYDEGGESPDLLMDITISVGDRVRLVNSLLFDMYVTGNVHAMGLVSKPLMSGKVDVEQGVVKYLTNNFTITEGNAIFGGVPDSFLPTLNLKGQAKVGQYKVNMGLTGPIGNFRFRLRSEPALSDSQIVTLLTFHRDSKNTGNSGDENQTGALFNAGLQMVFNGAVQNFLQNSFGLDLFTVTTSLDTYFDSKSANEKDEYYHIKIGKYLFDRFMLTATMGVNNSQKSFGFRYDLRSRWGITAWYNTETKAYVGAEYQFKF